MTCCGSCGSKKKSGNSEMDWGSQGFKIMNDDTFMVPAESEFAGWKDGYKQGCGCGGRGGGEACDGRKDHSGDMGGWSLIPDVPTVGIPADGGSGIRRDKYTTASRVPEPCCCCVKSIEVSSKSGNKLDPEDSGDAKGLELLRKRGLSANDYWLYQIKITLVYHGETPRKNCSLEWWEDTDMSLSALQYLVDFVMDMTPSVTRDNDKWIDRMQDPKSQKWTDYVIAEGLGSGLEEWREEVAGADCPGESTVTVTDLISNQGNGNLKIEFRVNSAPDCECDIAQVSVKAEWHTAPGAQHTRVVVRGGNPMLDVYSDPSTWGPLSDPQVVITMDTVEPDDGPPDW